MLQATGVTTFECTLLFTLQTNKNFRLSPVDSYYVRRKQSVRLCIICLRSNHIFIKLLNSKGPLARYTQKRKSEFAYETCISITVSGILQFTLCVYLHIVSDITHGRRRLSLLFGISFAH